MHAQASCLSRSGPIGKVVGRHLLLSLQLKFALQTLLEEHTLAAHWLACAGSVNMMMMKTLDSSTLVNSCLNASRVSHCARTSDVSVFWASTTTRGTNMSMSTVERVSLSEGVSTALAQP